MSRKNEVDWSFISFNHFYHGIQGDKTCNFVHDEAFECEMPILSLEFKRHTKSIMNVQFPLTFLSKSQKLCFWW